MAKVSVIVPVYNVESYLPVCMDSILAQTLKDIEIICVDDGSTDKSPAILDEYGAKDPRVRVLHKENEGYGKAVNTGIEAAAGNISGSWKATIGFCLICMKGFMKRQKNTRWIL